MRVQVLPHFRPERDLQQRRRQRLGRLDAQDLEHFGLPNDIAFVGRQLGKRLAIGLLRLLVLFLVSILFIPLYAEAATFAVTPAVIDGKGKVREILRYTVSVENTSDHLISVYPWVADVDKVIGSSATQDLGDAKNKELKISLARWIEVTRGVIDLLPGDRKEIPVLVQINLNAAPGLYMP